MSTDDELQAAILAAYAASAPQAGAPVGLAQLRDELGERFNRHDLDVALIRLSVKNPNVILFPESNQKTLRQADRDAALWMGNQWKHLIAVR
jgi:hypothetical protein